MTLLVLVANEKQGCQHAFMNDFLASGYAKEVPEEELDCEEDRGAGYQRYYKALISPSL